MAANSRSPLSVWLLLGTVMLAILVFALAAGTTAAHPQETQVFAAEGSFTTKGQISATPTSTPTSTPAPNCENYVYATATGTVVPGTTLLPGSQCDDCVLTMTLPFPFRLYDQTFSSTTVSSNGNLQFLSSSSAFLNSCLPATPFNYAIIPNWDDLWFGGSTEGIFTSISGSAPNRVFNIEWRGETFSADLIDVELRLYEFSPNGRFDVIYGRVAQSGYSTTVGVQKDTGSLFTQFECDTGGLYPGLMLIFTQSGCTTPSPTTTGTSPTATSTRTATITPPTSPPTGTPTPTRTRTPTVTSTPTTPPSCFPWAERAPYPTPAFSLMATSLNGDVYAFGGRDASYIRLSSTYRYRPSDNSWVQLASMPQICFWCSAIAVNGHIYIINGSHDTGPASDSSVYDPATNTWLAGVNGLVGTYGHATVNIGNTIYRIGGISGGGYTDTVEDYGNTLLAPLPVALAWPQAVAVPPYVYIAGGNTDGGLTAKTYRYDTTTDTWDDNAIADMPEARAWAASGIVDGKWVIVGGLGTENSAVEWDPQTNTWSNVAPPLFPRSDTGWATVNGTQLYLVGGLAETADNEVTGQVQVYDLSACATSTSTSTSTSTATTTTTVTVTRTRTPSPTTTGTPVPGCEPTWAFVPNPILSAWEDVDVLSSTDVWIVGAGTIARWNGTSWSNVQFPLPPGQQGYYLQDVAGPSSDDIWVVGSYELGGYYPLILHWNGIQWSTVSASPTIRGVIYSVTAIGQGEVMAVGVDSMQSDLPIALHCTPAGCVSTQPIGGGFFAGVWGTSPLDVWAVGLTSPSGHSFIEHYNGIQWQIVTAPNIGYLWDVNGTAGNDAWAVGDAGALHWNGTTWDQTIGTDNLHGVSAITSDDVWAVGIHIWHWDGAAWSQVHPGAIGPLHGISAHTKYDIWAVSNGAEVMRYTAQRFEDVPPSHVFYDYIENLSCQGVISGYPCGGAGEPCVPPGNRPYFRSSNNVSRGQLAKIVSQSAGFSEPVIGQTFQDIAPGSTFYAYIERLASRQVMGGYPCGGPSEPCVAPGNLPYFRPNNNATRGQISKIVSNAAAFVEPIPAGRQSFQDVPPGSTFYDFIERLASRGVMGGYQCGGLGEPCIGPGNLPYFRPNANATRGQTSKIVANTFFPNYATPSTGR